MIHKMHHKNTYGKDFPKVVIHIEVYGKGRTVINFPVWLSYNS